MKKAIRRIGSAEHLCSPKSFWSLQSQKNSSEFAKNLGRPVPCEQGAADLLSLREFRRPYLNKPAVSDLRGFDKQTQLVRICLD